MDVLATLVGSKTRAEIFRLLFQRAGAELYLRELQRRSGVSLRPVQQELSKLTKIGLVRQRNDGNRIYYGANTEHPMFPEIRGLVEKTAGVPALLETALADPDVELAFIFGSVGAGKARPDSDLDLLVVGDIGLRRLVKRLGGMSERVGRVINPHTMTKEEFWRKAQKKDHFLSNVLASQKVFLIGTEDELKRLAKKRLAQTPHDDEGGNKRASRNR
jgi:predicted nucleotidyltransferase